MCTISLFHYLPTSGGAPGLLAAGFRPRTPQDPEVRYGPYWRRQYVFVAATMPAATYNDVGTDIQKLYPDATWVATEALHTSKPNVTHAWHQVGGPCVLLWRCGLATSIIYLHLLPNCVCICCQIVFAMRSYGWCGL